MAITVSLVPLLEGMVWAAQLDGIQIKPAGNRIQVILDVDTPQTYQVQKAGHSDVDLVLPRAKLPAAFQGTGLPALASPETGVSAHIQESPEGLRIHLKNNKGEKLPYEVQFNTASGAPLPPLPASTAVASANTAPQSSLAPASGKPKWKSRHKRYTRQFVSNKPAGLAAAISQESLVSLQTETPASPIRLSQDANGVIKPSRQAPRHQSLGTATADPEEAYSLLHHAEEPSGRASTGELSAQDYFAAATEEPEPSKLETPSESFVSKDTADAQAASMAAGKFSVKQHVASQEAAGFSWQALLSDTPAQYLFLCLGLLGSVILGVAGLSRAARSKKAFAEDEIQAIEFFESPPELAELPEVYAENPVPKPSFDDYPVTLADSLPDPSLDQPQPSKRFQTHLEVVPPVSRETSDVSYNQSYKHLPQPVSVAVGSVVDAQPAPVALPRKSMHNSQVPKGVQQSRPAQPPKQSQPLNNTKPLQTKDNLLLANPPRSIRDAVKSTLGSRPSPYMSPPFRITSRYANAYGGPKPRRKFPQQSQVVNTPYNPYFNQ